MITPTSRAVMVIALAPALCSAAPSLDPSRHQNPSTHSCSKGCAAGHPALAAPGFTAQPPLWTDPDSDGFVGCGKMLLGQGWTGPWDGPLSFQPPEQGSFPPLPPGGGIGNRGPGGGDPTDVLHNHLDIEIIPASSTITGSNTMTIRSNAAAPGVTSFTFRLRSNYSVSACMVTDSIGSYSVTPTLPPANNTSYGRTITLARPIVAGDTFTVRVDYSGVAQTIAGSSIVFQTQNGQPLIWTLSEPYYAGTWWPCKDGDVRLPGDNADKATLTFSITAPSALRSVANGLLTSTQSLSGSRTKYTWSSSYPLPTYLVAFSSTNYNTWTAPYTHSGGTMTAEFNIYPASDNTTNRAAWQRSLDMLAAFRGVFGEYPFVNEKYGIYQFGFSGGMEHQTNSGQGGFGESLTAHELAHQWWGDWVTCKTWNDIWLNEGLATYGEAIWLERKVGSTGLPALRAAMNARRPSSVDGTVWNPDTTSINRIFSTNFTYLKSGWVFHQLRHVLGDSTFFELLALHRETHGGGAASTADFTSLASFVAGRDLAWYFQSWLYQFGAPAYETGWQNAVINGRNYVRIRIRQTQSGDYPAFAMPIDVRFDGAGIGGAAARAVLYNGAAESLPNQGVRLQHFLVPTDGPATGVVLDENDWILTLDKTSAVFSPGAAKIVESSVALNASVALAAAPSQVTFVFSDPVTLAASDVELRRGVLPGAPTSSGVVVPITVVYSVPTATLTVTTADGLPLRPDSYVLTINDSVLTASNARPLDGELPGTWAWIPIEGGSGHTLANPLPSGNGLDGGDAHLAFSIAPAACLADWNSSVTPPAADADDIFAFLNDWFAQLGTTGSDAVAPNYRSCDVDGSGIVDADDIFAFLNGWFEGCV